MTREEAIARIRRALEVPNRFGLALIDDETLDIAMKALSADRPQGEWVDYGDCEDICSICGYSKVHEPNYPFCPNCGADMRQRREE